MTLALEDIEDGQAFDVVVVGAGMVGACAALGLSATGLKVLLVEAFAIPESPLDYTPSYDARSTALSWGSCDILFQLGVWSAIQKHACPITSVHVSEQGRFGVTQMDAGEFDQEALGYVVPNQWLGQCLLARLATEPVTFCAPAKVTGITTGETLQTLHLSNADSSSKSITTQLLLIADGTHSKTAGLLGIESVEEDYGQHALIANVSTELPNRGIAYERFSHTGPVAMLPLTDSTSSLVWTLEDDQVQRFLEMDEHEFCNRLQDAFGDRLGRIENCGERNAYPLRLVRAKEQYRPGVLLLGNAAHSLHPIAGQGFNLALRGVASFLETIENARCRQMPIESVETLQHFCQAQKQDQEKTILFSDQLVKIFGSHSLTVGLVRDLGLIGLNNIPGFKSILARNAMGLAGKKARFIGLQN